MTNDITRRWNGCGADYEHCTNFFYAIRKFGWDNIKHEVLIDNLSKKKAEEYEQKYIEQYNSTNPSKGYNMTTGGFKCKKTSKRKVVQYDIYGNIVAIYLNQNDASNSTNISQAIISRICLHKQRTSKDGYVFRYEGDPFNIDNCETQQLNIPVIQIDENKNIINKYLCISDAAKIFGCHPSSIKSALNKNHRKCCGYYWCTLDIFETFSPCEKVKNRRIYKRVLQFDMQGNYITTYRSLREAGDIVGINHTQIGLVCKGERKQAGGYIWKFDDEEIHHTNSKKVCQIDIRTNAIIKVFESISDAKKETNICSSHIGSVCRGERNTAGGYIWRYID